MILCVSTMALRRPSCSGNEMFMGDAGKCISCVTKHSLQCMYISRDNFLFVCLLWWALGIVYVSV